MKKEVLSFVLFVLGVASYFSQSIENYKTKTAHNQIERAKILEVMRKEGQRQEKQSFIFKPSKFNVSSNGYAWVESEVFRKDGKSVRVEDWRDCCHSEAFLRKTGGQWKVVSMAFFSTDVWWLEAQQKWIRQGAPSRIFR